MLPTAADLDDPDGFVHHEQLDFSELDKILGEAAGGHVQDVPRDEDGHDGTDEGKGDDEK